MTQFSMICVIEINERIYEKLKTDPLPWKCPACISEIPFSQINNKDFKNLLYPTNTLQQPAHIIKKSSKEINYLVARFKQVNELLDPSENLTSCDYYDINYITNV